MSDDKPPDPGPLLPAALGDVEHYVLDEAPSPEAEVQLSRLIGEGAARQGRWWVAASVLVVMGYVLGATVLGVSAVVIGTTTPLMLVALILAETRPQPVRRPPRIQQPLPPAAGPSVHKPT